jgi:nicotinate-nucleotide adenylyltransferase
LPQQRRSHWIKLPPTAPGLRVGLLGGSFNPAHEGHRHISLEAIARLKLDQVWWLVSPGNPLKSHADLAAQDARLAAAAKIAHHPKISVTGLESELGTPFTAETLDFLATRCPQVRFVWLMGADNLASLHRWRSWRGIMQAVPVAVFDRPGWRYRGLGSRAASAFAFARLPEAESRQLALCRPPAWCFLSIPLSNLSSTKLRGNKSPEASPSVQ